MRKLTITEKDLVSIIAEAIKSNLDKTVRVGSPVYSHTKDMSMIREGLIMSYEPSHVKNIINKTGLLPYIGNNCSIAHEFKGGNSHTVRNGKYKATKPYNTTKDINRLVLLKLVIEGTVNKDGLKPFKEVEHRFNACGYFFSGIMMRGDGKFYKPEQIDDIWNYMSENNGYYEFLFEPRYDVNVHIDDIPDFCYHICETSKVNKILAQGLKPSSGNRVSSHPERVYLFLWKPDNWKGIVDAFSESRSCNNFTLLEIDTYKLRDKIKFYFDQNTFQYYPDAIYTLEPIPSECIKAIDRYVKEV